MDGLHGALLVLVLGMYVYIYVYLYNRVGITHEMS